jgi:putative ABC transport system permease protein
MSTREALAGYAPHEGVTDSPRPRPRNRVRAMMRVGVRMMFHDRLKLLGTLFGVVFAVLLAVQQLSILFGLLEKNTMFVSRSKADIWLAPPNTQQLQTGEMMGPSVLARARTTAGVAQAEPLLFVPASLDKPDGGTEPVTLVGVSLPHQLGGPWAMVQGSADVIASPDTLVFEDSERERYGNLNLYAVRELNGYRVRAGGFTWGLLPFGPAYAFGEIDLVRTLTATPVDRMNFVLIRAHTGEDIEELVARLRSRIPEVTVLTSSAFSRSIAGTLLRQQLGITFGVSTSFGLAIGFIIVALSMFSAVLDNLREFGTLKAIGCRNGDLTILVFSQSLVYAAIGSLIGLGLVTRVADGIRSAKLVPIIPQPVYWIVPPLMLGICLVASGLALSRIRKLEPAMVFR